MAVSSDLLEILRCPADVRNGPDAGMLDLVRADAAVPFLVCRDCGRKYPIKTDIPIILISGKNTPLDKQWGLQQGADMYITKPFSKDELLASVRSLI